MRSYPPPHLPSELLTVAAITDDVRSREASHLAVEEQVAAYDETQSYTFTISGPSIVQRPPLPGPDVLQALPIGRHDFVLENYAIDRKNSRQLTEHLGVLGIATYADLLAVGGDALFERVQQLQSNRWTVGVRDIYHAVRQATGRRLPDLMATPEELRWYYTDANQLPVALAAPAASPDVLHQLAVLGKPLRTVSDWHAATELFPEAAQRTVDGTFAHFEDLSAIMRRMFHDIVPRFVASETLPSHTAAERDAAVYGKPWLASLLQRTALRPWHFEKALMAPGEAAQSISVLRIIGLHTYADVLAVGSQRVLYQAATVHDNNGNTIGSRRLDKLGVAMQRITGHSLRSEGFGPQELRRLYTDTRLVPMAAALPFGMFKGYVDVRPFDTPDQPLRTVGGWIGPDAYRHAQAAATSRPHALHTLTQIWQHVGKFTGDASIKP